MGRGLRPSPGKPDCVVLDMVGNTLYHGAPTDPYPLSLHMTRDKAREEKFEWKFDTRPKQERDGSHIKVFVPKHKRTAPLERAGQKHRPKVLTFLSNTASTQPVQRARSSRQPLTA